MLPANEQFCMWNVCDMAADDMSSVFMELHSLAKVEQVAFLREALLQHSSGAHGTGSHPASARLCVMSRQMNARDTATATVNGNGIQVWERSSYMFLGYVSD